MKMLMKLILIALVVVVSIIESAECSKPEFPSPFKLQLEPNPLPNSAGPARLSLTIISTRACGEITVSVSGVENLEYIGEPGWTLSPNVGDTNRFELSIVIPESDTSGILITAKCGNWPNFTVGAYFTTDKEKVSFHHSRPFRVDRTPIGVPRDMSDPPMTEELRQGKQTTCYEDEEGNLVPIDSIFDGLSPTGKRVGTIDQDGNFIPLDSLLRLSSGALLDTIRPSVQESDRSKAWTRDSEGKQIRIDRDSLMKAIKEQKIEAEYEKMRELEKSPLAEYDKQYLKVDGKNYRRYRGEYKFHLVETITNPISHSMQQQDSINISKGRVFEINLDLSDLSDLEYAKKKVEKLIPMDSAGFYNATVDWQTIQDFQEKGIRFYRSGFIPNKDSQSDQEESAKKKSKYKQ